jgi:hypothetical protein
VEELHNVELTVDQIFKELTKVLFNKSEKNIDHDKIYTDKEISLLKVIFELLRKSNQGMNVLSKILFADLIIKEKPAKDDIVLLKIHDGYYLGEDETKSSDLCVNGYIEAVISKTNSITSYNYATLKLKVIEKGAVRKRDVTISYDHYHRFVKPIKVNNFSKTEKNASVEVNSYDRIKGIKK